MWGDEQVVDLGQSAVQMESEMMQTNEDSELTLPKSKTLRNPHGNKRDDINLSY